MEGPTVGVLLDDAMAFLGYQVPWSPVSPLQANAESLGSPLLIEEAWLGWLGQ